MASKSHTDFSTNEKKHRNESLAMRAFFSRALGKLQVIARNFHWFIALFGPVVIGRINQLLLVFFDSHLKATVICSSYKKICNKKS